MNDFIEFDRLIINDTRGIRRIIEGLSALDREIFAGRVKFPIVGVIIKDRSVAVGHPSGMSEEFTVDDSAESGFVGYEPIGMDIRRSVSVKVTAWWVWPLLLVGFYFIGVLTGISIR